jgi:hypothetical protein
MKKQLFVREYAFTFHQMIMLLGFSAISLMIFIQFVAIELTVLGYGIALLFLMLGLYFLALTFSKKALIKKNGNLFKGKSIAGFVLSRKKINLDARPVLSILSFKKNQKFAFVSAARPDQADSFNSFELFILNEKHTQRDSLLYFKNKKNAEAAVAFLTTNFSLRQEVFSPDFS